ncbi:CDP-glycerol glycerophosphotransferase family protein [Terrisporobacter sp.]
MQNVLLENISIDDNKLLMVSDRQIGKIMLKNDDFSMECNVEDNYIDFTRLIKKNKKFLGLDRVCTLMCLDENEEYVSLSMNEKKDGLSTCKEMKFTIDNQDYIVSIFVDKANLVKVSITSPMRPSLEKVYYDKGVVLEGKLNLNKEISAGEKVEAKLCLISKDNKISNEYPMETDLNEYKVKLEDEDISFLKDSSISRWNLSVKIYMNNEEIINGAIIKENEEILPGKISLFTESIDFDKETIIAEVFIPKKLNTVAMLTKNLVNVTKIISVMRKDNRLRVRYRTRENIVALVDSKSLNIDIETPDETLTQKSIRKAGKKTVVVEYYSKDGEKFAADMHKKGVTLYIKTPENQGISMLSGIDKDIIFTTLWKRVQASKKYKRAARGVYKKAFTKMPVKKDWIVYESFLGRNMSDSPKYIYEYLRDNYPDKYKHIWVFNEKREDLPKDIVQVKRFSFEHLYYIAKSKYWVNNMRQPKWFKKRDNQVFLETWHGTPLKKLVFDMKEVHSANKNYKKDFYIQSRAWDYLVSANDYSTEIFKRAFKFDNPILEYGYPRNDLMYHPNKDEVSRKLKEKLGIPLDKKIVLYAPTWRDDEFFKPGKYKFNLEIDLRRLREELGDQYFFVLRTHYFIANHIDVDGLEDFVYNASQYDDITELYLLSDVLITDYSSVFFDYANLKRPILFFTYDLEKYRDTLRGFYLDLQTEGPGPIVMTNDEIIEELRDFDKLTEKYKDRVESFHDRFCTMDDGEASKRIAEEIIVNS